MTRPCSDNFHGSAVFFLQEGSSEVRALTKGVTLPDNARVVAVPYHPTNEAPAAQDFSRFAPPGAYIYALQEGHLRLSYAADSNDPAAQPADGYERHTAQFLLGVLRDRSPQDAKQRISEKAATLIEQVKSSSGDQLKRLADEAAAWGYQHSVSTEFYANTPFAELSDVASTSVIAHAHLIAERRNLDPAAVLATFDPPTRDILDRVAVRDRLNVEIQSGTVFATIVSQETYNDDFWTHDGTVIDSVWPTAELAAKRAEVLSLHDELFSSVTYTGSRLDTSTVALSNGADHGTITRQSRLGAEVSFQDAHPAVFSNAALWVVMQASIMQDEDMTMVENRIAKVFTSYTEASKYAATLGNIEVPEDLSQVYVSNHLLHQTDAATFAGLADRAVAESRYVPAENLAKLPSATLCAYPIH
jgi:hypothetical protein